MRSSLLLGLLLVCLVAVKSDAEDAQSLLTAALSKYANLSAYYIAGTRESNASDEVQRRWEQERFTLARESERRYHYEIRMPGRWNVIIADGQVEWQFQPWRSEYVQHEIPTTKPNAEAPDDVIRYVTEHQARFYLDALDHGIDLKTAAFLTPEILSIAGQKIPSYVIHARFKNTETGDSTSGVTFWIEKERNVIRKETSVSTFSPSVMEPLRKVQSVETTSYEIVDLQETPPAALFSFASPKGAKEVRRLFLDDRSIDLTGFPAPPLNLKTLDGKDFDSNSLKGHTVLVDFWASWCVPCRQQMPSLAKLTHNFANQGLLFVGVDWGDDDPEPAREFLRKNSYGWTNLRADKETTAAWMLNGVPLVAIVDPKGQIAYYHSGYEQPEEIAIVDVLRKIDPAFKSAEAPPCNTAQKQ